MGDFNSNIHRVSHNIKDLIAWNLFKWDLGSLLFNIANSAAEERPSAEHNFHAKHDPKLK